MSLQSSVRMRFRPTIRRLTRTFPPERLDINLSPDWDSPSSSYAMSIARPLHCTAQWLERSTG